MPAGSQDFTSPAPRPPFSHGAQVQQIGVPDSARRHRWSFFGAGVLVATGYMDPGNWATGVGAGAQYGYELLSAVVIASLMGLLLQWLASRVGIVTGRDLAELCREHYSRRTTWALWIACEIAIIACDVAEIVGCAVALQLLLGVSLVTGVLLSAVGTFALLMMPRYGLLSLQFVIIALTSFVCICFVVELVLVNPSWRSVLGGVIPSAELLRNTGLIWFATGILGATVMPHNLYLHSALVKHHATLDKVGAIVQAMKSVNTDTALSLGIAFLVNAALLIVAAAVFHANGHTNVTDLADAHHLIAPLVGNEWASIIFAAALLACGLNATITGTMAGQIVMEGFLHLKGGPKTRAYMTRLLAIGPALLAISLFGEHGSNHLLIASQVVLSVQLPLAMIPLIHFASNAKLMGIFQARWPVIALAWSCVGITVALNTALIWRMI